MDLELPDSKFSFRDFRKTIFFKTSSIMAATVESDIAGLEGSRFVVCRCCAQLQRLSNAVDLLMCSINNSSVGLWCIHPPLISAALAPSSGIVIVLTEPSAL